VNTTDLIFLVILIGIVLALVIASLMVVRGRRIEKQEAAKTPPVETPAEQESAEEQEQTESQPQAPPLDIPEAPEGRLARLRRKLSAAENPFARGLLSLLSADKLDEETYEDLEATLITADLGVAATTELIDALRTEIGISGGDTSKAKQVLHDELVKLGKPELDRTLNVEGADGKPGVVLVVGVNGTGKTTTIGKLARVLVAEGHTLVLGAADTFRAAAADQLETWGSRVGAETVRGTEGADPASVAFAAVQRAIEAEVDTALIDTAGRLHTKTGLMDELGKVKRVIEKQAPITEVLLVLDATTGQNGLIQAKVFAEVVDVTGIVLTKLDGSAKGGIVFSVQQELGVPVKLVGLGEGPDDLAPFDVEEFVDALLS
jgi:fused signal recognition particle receptor